METLKTLEHDHIVRYIAYVDDPPSLCMEYIDGESLMHLVQNKIQLNQRDTKEYSRHILLGLEYLHNRDPSIIHRDLNCTYAWCFASLLSICCAVKGIVFCSFWSNVGE